MTTGHIQFNSAQLRAWRARMGYSTRQASEALGCSRSALARWESGEAETPRYISLACAALALGVDPYGSKSTEEDET